jgi:hypothetical protein
VAWLAAVTSIAILLAPGCGGAQTTTAPTPQAAGPKGDAWAWDGVTWKPVAGPGPSSRYSAALAYDAKRSVFVLFGGQTAKGSSDETWTWDGKAWKAQSPAHKPSPRRSTAMAYDPERQVVVLYGGLIEDPNEGREGGDTWTWDGTDWTEVDRGPGAPGTREGATLVTAENQALLFGGRFVNELYYGDAWTWSGKTWSRVDKNPLPPGRSNSAVAWNPAGSSLFVYGGSGLNASAGPGAAGLPLADAWSLSRAKWTELKGSGPPALALANAIWDQKGNRWEVLMGISCPNPSDAAWAWDGTAWSKLARPGIPARWGAAVAQAPDGRALLFGGSDQAGC